MSTRFLREGVAMRGIGLSRAFFIVPGAHVRFDRAFQTEMFELFHGGSLARWGHLVCTPLINVALLTALASLLPGSSLGPFALDGAMLGVLAILVWSFHVDRAAGLVLVPCALLAAVVARELATALGEHALSLSLFAAWLLGAVQTFSHLSEPIPPPWSGSHGFLPLRAFLESAPGPRIASLLLLAGTVFVVLEVWAAPRVWALEVLHVLMRAGYRPELRERLDGRVAEMLRDARTGWT
jgi:hypothetical protein